MTTKKKPDEPSVVDEMAEDATPEEYPEGAPELIPYLKLRPRSRRAEFKRQMGRLEPLKDRIGELRASGVFDEKNEQVTTQDRANAAAEVDDMYQQMDDLLTLAAKDPAAYRVWSDELEDDNELASVFNVYMRRTQPGEASSSAS